MDEIFHRKMVVVALPISVRSMPYRSCGLSVIMLVCSLQKGIFLKKINVLMTIFG